MVLIFRVFLFAVIGAFSFAFVLSAADAQTIVQSLKKPMPEFELMSEEEFNKSSTLYNEVPFDDETLGYTVRLPKNWSKQDNGAVGNFTLSNKILGEFSRYYGPVRMGERSYFSVKAVELEYQLTAEQWLILFMLENSYTIEGMETVNDSRAEVIYVVVERGQTYIAYAAAQLSGSRVIFSQYIMPVEEWGKERASAHRVVKSFDVTNKDAEFIEDMSPYQFLDIAEMKYPDSWELIAKPLRSADRMSVSLLNVIEKNRFSKQRLLKGKMEVHLASEFIVEDIESDIENFKKEMSVNKLLIQDEIEELEDFVLDENMELIEVKAYDAIDQSQSVLDYEFWLAVMHTGEYYYFLTLLTPSRNADYFNWARNTQTFRVVVENIGPLE